MTELQQQIEDKIASIVHLEKVANQLANTEKELKEANSQIRKMDKLLQRELRDIEKLEGLTTRAVFHKVLGDQKEQLEKERQEYLELSLKYEDVINRVRILEYEINLLEAKLGNKTILVTQLEQLKQRREEEIIHTDPELRAKLLKISQSLEYNYRLKKELQEAIEVGNLCYNLTSQVVGHLEKVRNWGRRQGRQKGSMHRMMRREAIDRARNITYQVKHHLSLFDRELRDLGQKLTISLDDDILSNFTDFFFDNLITDWIMQQKVTKALGAVNHTKRQLAFLLKQLNKELDDATGQIFQLKEEREKVLLA